MLKLWPTLDESIDPELLEWQNAEDAEDGKDLIK